MVVQFDLPSTMKRNNIPEELHETSVKKPKVHQTPSMITMNMDKAKVEYTPISLITNEKLSKYKNWLEQNVKPLFKPTFVTVFNKKYEERRRVIGLGDEGIKYAYSGSIVEAVDWKDMHILQEMKDDVLKICRITNPDLPDPNFVLLNWFRDGFDKIGSHADSETDLIKELPIISLSIGASRRFVFNTKTPNKKADEVMLRDGMVVVMHPGTQTHYKHSIPEMKTVKTDRWSLTFRYVKK